MNKDQRGNVRGMINQPRVLQPKTIQQQKLQPVPHINQHSIHMQRAAQAKMAQTRPGLQHAPLVKTAARQSSVQAKLRTAPVPSRASGVVQRANCLTGVGEFFTSMWNKLPSCCPTSRRDQYDEILDMSSSDSSSDISFSGSISSVSKTVTPIQKVTWVQEEQTETGLTYPGSVEGGYISSCALVIFCDDDSFDCYHAKSGHYKSNHNLMTRPKHIYYVYKVEINDKESTIEEYRRNANLFRQLAGNRAPLTFYGQTGVRGNVWVDVHSAGNIQPRMGAFK